MWMKPQQKTMSLPGQTLLTGEDSNGRSSTEEQLSSLYVTTSTSIRCTRGGELTMAEKPLTADVSPSLSPSHPVAVGEMGSEEKRRSFVDAAWDKFNGDMSADDCIGIYVPKKGPAKITDSGHLILPWRVHMTECGITEAGQLNDMTPMCRHVTELDLAGNNFTCLEEVLQVIRCMPQLTFLNLTSNPLHSSSIPSSFPTCPTTTATITTTTITITSPATTPSDDSEEASGGTDEDLSPASPPGPSQDTPTTSGVQAVGDPNANMETAVSPTSSTTASTTAATPSSSFTSTTNNNQPTETFTQETREATCSEGEGDAAAVSGASSPVSAFSTVRQLVLNNTGIGWPGILGLLRLFPSLEELHLSINRYSTVDMPQDFVYPSLSRLFFNYNDVHNWAQVCRLGRHFPSLQELYLAETAVASLAQEESEKGVEELFPSLRLLSLNKTQLKGWEEVDRLRSFPSLVDVRLQGIPFLEAEEEKARRQQLVARLPNVKHLNGSRVMEEERLDAERAFIRLFLDSQQKPDRYYELEQVHGKLDPLVKVSLEPQVIFQVQIVMDDRRERLEINSNQTVRDLKKSLQNMVGLPSSKFTLYYNDLESGFGPDNLKFPDKKLYTLNLADGDEFIIIPKP